MCVVSIEIDIRRSNGPDKAIMKYNNANWQILTIGSVQSKSCRRPDFTTSSLALVYCGWATAQFVSLCPRANLIEYFHIDSIVRTNAANYHSFADHSPSFSRSLAIHFSLFCTHWCLVGDTLEQMTNNIAFAVHTRERFQFTMNATKEKMPRGAKRDINL